MSAYSVSLSFLLGLALLALSRRHPAPDARVRFPSDRANSDIRWL